jgi:hypothetical protein
MVGPSCLLPFWFKYALQASPLAGKVAYMISHCFFFSFYVFSLGVSKRKQSGHEPHWPTHTLGIFQDYYEQHVFGSSPGVVFYLSLVGSSINCFMNLMAVLSQVLLARLGSRGAMFVAAVLCTSGLVLASLSSEVCRWYVSTLLMVVEGK